MNKLSCSDRLKLNETNKYNLCQSCLNLPGCIYCINKYKRGNEKPILVNSCIKDNNHEYTLKDYNNLNTLCTNNSPLNYINGCPCINCPSSRGTCIRGNGQNYCRCKR